MILYILLTLRTMFKCPFGFGLLFVNNLFCVWYVIYIFFLSLILLVCCLLGAENSVGLWFLSPFMGCIFIYQKLVRFVSFMGLMTSSYLCLLMEPSALLPWLSYRFVLSVGFITLPIYGVLL